MSPISRLLRLITITMICKASIQGNFRSSYGVRINYWYPTSSCVRYNNIQSLGKCFATCLQKMENFYLFSQDLLNHECLCCKDVPGTPLTGSEWKTFLPIPCPSGYTTIMNTFYEICVKYVPTPTMYDDAVSRCNEDGGDLFKIDSEKKYEIFKELLGPFTATNEIQIWVQGVEENNQWKFHDGTPIPNICPIRESNNANEIHLRSHSGYNFDCIDDPPSNKHDYICEIDRFF
ncbi:uncharacterized protein LOC134249445 [Saccostrea cucullata]|uniref:uncharacterized protein LOC134249445 n=1 Tax=Saccostrea cuccullata TaxID=36930 RepID=UPI002ED2F49F